MPKLSAFFNIQSQSLPWATSITQSPAFSQAKPMMVQQLTGVPLPKNFYEFLVTKLEEVLDIDIGDVLVWGWRKREEIIQYRDKPNPSGKPHKVKLLTYVFESRHTPDIQPVVNGVPLGKLKFDIVLKLITNEGILFIQDGKITEIKAVSCMGSGSIEYAGITLIEKKTATLELPPSIPFDPPISI